MDKQENNENLELSINEEEERIDKFADPIERPGLIKKAKEHGLAQKLYYINEKNFKPEKAEFCECCQLPLPIPGMVEDFRYCVDPKKLASAGIGTYLFFFFFKFLLFGLFVIVGMCSIPFVIISKSYANDLISFCRDHYYQSSICEEIYNKTLNSSSSSMDWLFVMSYQSVNMTLTIMRNATFNKTNIINEYTDSVVDYSLINLIAMLTLLVINFFFIVNLHNLIKEADYGQITPSDFTVMIRKVEKDFKNLDHLVKEYIQVNEVEPYDLNLTFKLDEYFQYQEKLSSAQKKYHMLKLKKEDQYISGCCMCKKTETVEDLKNTIKENKHLIKDYMEEINDLSSNEYFNGVVFATFKDYQDLNKYLGVFPKSFIGSVFTFFHYILANFLCCCVYSDKKKRMLRRAHSLIVERAPEPEDVLWENLQYSSTSRFFRMILVYFISLILIGIGFGIILGFNYFQLYADEEGWTSIVEVKYTISILISLTISIINYLIMRTMNQLTSIEKNISMTNYHLSFSIKLSVLTFINSAVVPLVSNYLNHQWKNLDILINNLLIIFLSNAFATPFYQLLNLFYCLGKFKRWRLEKKYKEDEPIVEYNQRELNALYENPMMEISYKYSWGAKTFLMTVFYLPLFPLGTIISILGVILTYLIEKFNLLNTYKRPQMLNEEMCSFYINYFKLMLFTYSIGNYIFLHNVYDSQIFSLSMIILFGVLIIIPFHNLFTCQCLGKNEEDLLEKPYIDFYFMFSTDYQRQNPLTRRKGNLKYLERLYEKNIIDDQTYADLSKRMIKEDINMIELYYKTNATIETRNKNRLKTQFSVGYGYQVKKQKSNYFGNGILRKTTVFGDGFDQIREKAFHNFVYDIEMENKFYSPIRNDEVFIPEGEYNKIQVEHQNNSKHDQTQFDFHHNQAYSGVENYLMINDQYDQKNTPNNIEHNNFMENTNTRRKLVGNNMNNKYHKNEQVEMVNLNLNGYSNQGNIYFNNDPNQNPALNAHNNYSNVDVNNPAYQLGYNYYNNYGGTANLNMN